MSSQLPFKGETRLRQMHGRRVMPPDQFKYPSHQTVQTPKCMGQSNRKLLFLPRRAIKITRLLLTEASLSALTHSVLQMGTPHPPTSLFRGETFNTRKRKGGGQSQGWQGACPPPSRLETCSLARGEGWGEPLKPQGSNTHLYSHSDPLGV